MGLRITQNSIYNQTQRALSRSFESGLKVREQISSGRRVNRPSDDPATMMLAPGSTLASVLNATCGKLKKPA